MEIFELRYFLAVARDENVHRASEALNVSPAALSKAIARLEDELGSKLFSREGRGIRLTEPGRMLQRRASEILRIEEAARLEIGGSRGALRAVIAGPEVLLARFGLAVAGEIRKRHPRALFEFHAVAEAQALDEVARNDAHLAIVTADAPSYLVEKTAGQASFQTFAGQGHPLYAAARAGRTVPIEEVLRHGFASPSHPLLGKVGNRQSLDGWRDDRFPRRIEYLASSLKILEELVVGGKALAYLPDHFGERLDARVLRISGCPYSCTQKIKYVARNPQDLGWLNQLF